MKNNGYFMLSAVIVLLAGFFVAACSASASVANKTPPEELELFFFYEESCASCNGAAEYNQIASEQLKDVWDDYPYVTHKINIFTSGGMEEYKKLTGEMGLDASAFSTPLLIIGDDVFQGLDSIENSLREAFISAGENMFK